MRKILVSIVFCLTLMGCSSLGMAPLGLPTLSGLAHYDSPKASVLGPACAVATPTQDDKNACDVFKANVIACKTNLDSIGGKVNGALMFVPQYGPTAAAVNGAVVLPILDKAQMDFCVGNGYVVPVNPTPAPSTK